MAEQLQTTGRGRLDELDYLKCVMVVLMVSFHLVHISDTYPYAKQVVYTFHMPVFLILSGFLMKVEKDVRPFLRTIFWFLVPYLVMESGYTLMASVLPIREHIDQLTPLVLLDKLFVSPLGPYWYLHTLILCGLTYYGVFRLKRLSLLSRWIVMGLAFAFYAYVGLVSLDLSLYFLAGAVVRHSGLPFLSVFRASWLSLPALLLLVVHPSNVQPYTVGSVLIVYLVMSLLLAVYPFVPGAVRRGMLFLGRNTLIVFLFSPIFTILCKPLVPLLSFDASAMLFLVVSLAVCLTGSIAVGWLLDRCRVSPLMFGRQRVVVPFT